MLKSMSGKAVGSRMVFSKDEKTKEDWSKALEIILKNKI